MFPVNPDFLDPDAGEVVLNEKRPRASRWFATILGRLGLYRPCNWVPAPTHGLKSVASAQRCGLITSLLILTA